MDAGRLPGRAVPGYRVDVGQRQSGGTGSAAAPVRHDFSQPGGDPVACESEDCYDFNMEFDKDTGTTIVPGGGYSMGTGFQAYHFNVESTGRSRRGAEATHTQSVYIIGPGG